MVEKPGWWTWWWERSWKEGVKRNDKLNYNSSWIKSKQVWWRLGHTLEEVEQLLEIERNKKRTK